MDIREFRIDRFGCWQDVTVHSLPPGINVIHLDDGGRPADLAEFLFQVLYGFDTDNHTSAGGAIVFDDGHNTLTLDRQTSTEGITAIHTKWNGELLDDVAPLLAKARASVAGPMAARFFVPAHQPRTTTAARSHREAREHADTHQENWEWLVGQPDLRTWLQLDPELEASVPDQAVHVPSPTPPRPVRSPIDLEGPLRQQRQLRTELLQRIELTSGRLEACTSLEDSAQPVPRLQVAEIEDELAMLRARRTPLEQALRLTDKWRQRAKLRIPEGEALDLAKLQKAFTKHGELEKKKAKHQRVFKRTPTEKDNAAKRKKNRNQSALAAIDRLLKHQDRILTPLTNTEPLPTSSPAESVPADILCAVRLVEEARRDVAHADRRFSDFVEENGDDWDACDEATTMDRMEIAADSPVSDAPLALQLDELKRRKLWVEQEHQCLLERESIYSQTQLWTTILFSLSVAALFGVLVVISYLGQLALVALGLSGVVASGALKMSLERRSSERIRRAHQRLHQIDQEIGIVAQQLLDEDRAAIREQRRQQGLQLQNTVAETNHRLDSAETAFRELLLAKGLSPSLSIEEAVQSDRHRRPARQEGPRDKTVSPQRRRWIAAAQRLLQGTGAEPRSDDPTELLSDLELLKIRLQETCGHGSDARSQRQLVLQEAKRELARLNKAQQVLLRRVKMHDVFELESAIEKARHRLELRQQWQQLEDEITAYLDSSEDGQEVRELLETYDTHELELRLAEVKAHQAELESMLRQHREEETLAPASRHDEDAHELSRQLDELRTQLAETDEKVQELEEQQQVQLREEAAAREQSSEHQEPVATSPPAPKPQPIQDRFGFLHELTDGQYDTLRLLDDQLLLSHSNNDKQPTRVDFDSQLAQQVWLTLRLRVAASSLSSDSETLPVVIMADEIVNQPFSIGAFRVLERATAAGVQVLLLSGDQQVVEQWVAAGASAVRIGLREELAFYDAEEAWLEAAPPQSLRELSVELQEALREAA